MGLPGVPVPGTPNSGTSTVGYTLPSHVAGDDLFLFIECSDTVGITAPLGWAHIPNSPRAQGSNVVSINILWRRATSNSTPNPTVAAASNHQTGFAVKVSGAVPYGFPWVFNPVGSGTAAATSFSATGGTSAEPDIRAMIASANAGDISGDQFSSVSNGTLSGFAEVDQSWTTLGNGGGVGVWSGTRTTPGATGTTTGSIGISGSVSNLVFALAGAPDGVLTVETLSASQTWVAPAGVTTVHVECLGAGGGGGGGTGLGNGGGGGGGGAYAYADVAVTPGSGYAVTVGSAGSGGGFGAANGGAGGDSSFATNVIAKGGAGGLLGSNGGTGGAAGTLAGSTGTDRLSGVGGASQAAGGGGNGGAGAQPFGGPGGSTGGNPGAAGTAPGGGGKGGNNTTGGSGGAGAAGQVRLYYVVAATPAFSGWGIPI